MRGYRHTRYFLAGDDPALVHRDFAATLDRALGDIARIQAQARTGETTGRPSWPMIVLRTPKGWTGPKEVDGVPVEGTFRSHQLALAESRANRGHLKQLEEWLRSYRPEELFDENGRVRADLRVLAPRGDRRMSANAVANGGLLLRPGPSGLPRLRRRSQGAGGEAE